MKSLLIILGFALYTVSTVQAQTGNEFQGLSSGLNITTGSFNTLYGDFSGRDLTTSQYNTFIGYASGIFVNSTSTLVTARNTALGALTLRQVASGNDNTALGYTAGYNVTSGDYNVLAGSRSGYLLTTGGDNVALGYESGYSLTSGNDNVFNGFRSGYFSTTAFDNTFSGNGAGFNLTTANRNVFSGNLAGSNVTTGNENVAIGSRSGGAISTVTSSTTATTAGATGNENVSIGESANRLLTTGYSNTTVGHDAAYDITSGHHNVVMGDSAGIDIGVAFANTFIGAGSGSSTEHTSYNTFIGYYSGKRNNVSNSTFNAQRNTFLGAFSGDANEEGSDNIMIGYNSDFFADGTNRSIAIGTNAILGNTFTDLIGSIAIGDASSANASYATSLGFQSSANQAFSMALGANASANSANSLVIGGNSSTDRMSVGIGTSTPNQLASMDLAENDHGFLVSRMTTAEETTFTASLSTTEEGMMIFNTTDDQLKVWDGSQWVTSESQDLSLSGNTLSLSDDNTTVDLSQYLDNTDTQLNEAQVDAFVANNGYLSNFTEVDGDITNEIQDISLTGNNLAISSGSTVDLSQYLDNTDTQLNEAQVDAFVANNGYLSNFVEVDGDITNEIQDISLTGNNLAISSGSTVDLSQYLDNTDTQLNEAQVDAFVSNNGYLSNFIEVDGDITNEIQDIQLNGSNLTISSGSTIDLSAFNDNTDEQNLTAATLTGTTLEIEIENGASVSVDLAPLLADLQNQITALDDRLTIIEGCACDSTLKTSEINGIIEEPILYQNIPNPFNATSSIKYFIPSWANEAEIVVSNEMGQMISRIDIQEVGDYGTAHINAEELASGTYFYTLYVNQSLIDTKRMVVE